MSDQALDADRLTAIIESRMSRELAFVKDDGKQVEMLNPEQVGWALAHLYQTGDVVSGLPALPAEPADAGLPVDGVVAELMGVEAHLDEARDRLIKATNTLGGIARAALAAEPVGEEG